MNVISLEVKYGKICSEIHKRKDFEKYAGMKLVWEFTQIWII